MKYFMLCPLCLLIMALFIYYEKNQKYKLAVCLKGLASLVFFVLGYLGSKMCSDLQFSKAVITGLLLGVIADVLLNLRYVFKNGKPVFLVGILVFLSGHIAYLKALIPSCNNVVLCFVIGAILTAILLVWIFKQIEAAIAFKVFGVFYIGAITIMNVVAISNCFNNPVISNIIFVTGAISFLISDIVLILNTFGKESKFSLRVTNLSLYYIGQLLIAISLQFI